MCPPKLRPEKPQFPKGRVEQEYGSNARDVPVVVFIVTAVIVLAVSFLRAYLNETGVL